MTLRKIDENMIDDKLTNKVNDVVAKAEELKVSLADTGAESANGLSKKATDQTAELNAYFNVLSDKGIRYADFNKNEEYIANGNLTDSYKVIKIGNAKIKKTKPDNLFVHIANTFKSFNGKINSMSIRDMKSTVDTGNFKQLVNAISQNRTVKVAFIGDSITAGTPDTSDFSTRISKSSLNGYRTSTDAIVTDNSYVHRIMNKLTEQFPNTTFSLNNYAVSGTRIDLWDTTQTYWGTSKVWIDWLKEAKPDLVFIAFGMNHNNFDYAKTFAYDLKSMIEYIQTKFSPIPDIVVVTNPRPIYVPGHVDWGNFENQGGRVVAQNAARAIAKEYGAYVMDVGRLSDIKRIGLDYTRPIMKRMSLKDFDITTTNATKNADDSFDFAAIGTSIINLKGNYQKDFTIKLNVTFTAPAANDNNALALCYNKVRDTDFYDNRLRIRPKSSGNFAIFNSQVKVADHTNWGSSGISQSFTDDEHYDGLTKTFIVSKRAEKIEVRLVDNYNAEHVVLQDYADVLDVHGFFQIRYESSGVGNTAKLNSIEINGAEYPEYIPSLTDNEMWGGFVDGNLTTKLPYGGNGANHPSSIGVEEVYRPCIDELVDDIVAKVVDNNRNDSLALFPVTETKDSNTLPDATLSYLTINTKLLSARLVKSDGTIFKLNKNITGWNGSIALGGPLGTNEFGMYKVSETQSQLLIKSSPANAWQVTTYQ